MQIFFGFLAFMGCIMLAAVFFGIWIPEVMRQGPLPEVKAHNDGWIDAQIKAHNDAKANFKTEGCIYQYLEEIQYEFAIYLDRRGIKNSGSILRRTPSQRSIFIREEMKKYLESSTCKNLLEAKKSAIHDQNTRLLLSLLAAVIALLLIGVGVTFGKFGQ
ncbi:MAG: hypothetical protein NTY09_08435 [bacterium]|nr:hypothetical protein [bacterium]